MHFMLRFRPLPPRLVGLGTEDLRLGKGVAVRAAPFLTMKDDGDDEYSWLIHGEFVAIRVSFPPALARRRFRLAGKCLVFR